MITAPGPGGFSCPPLLQQAVCPPCLPRPSPSSGHPSPASSRETKRLPLTLALSDELGRGIATVYVGPWSECQPKQQAFKRERRDTRTRESSSLRENRPRSLPVPQAASPHFPLPWLPASSPSPSGPSSPPPQLGERQRNVVCRSVPEYQRRINILYFKLAERQAGQPHLSKSAWTGVERQWFPQIVEVVLYHEIVRLPLGPRGVLPFLSHVLQVLLLSSRFFGKCICSNNLFRLAMQSDISSHFPSSASVLSTLNI